mgnify:CR=1 FL=1
MCVDVVIVEKIRWLDISELKISWDKKFKWEGYVEKSSLQEWCEIVKDKNQFTYSLLNLVSGCIFQTIYEQYFLNKKEISFEDCFCFNKNCIGNFDYNNYFEIISKFRNIHPDTRGNIQFLNFIERDIIQDYYSKIIKMRDFFDSLKKIIDSHSITVFENFKIKDNIDSYSYCFKEEKLKKLIKEIKLVNDKHGFGEVLEITSEKIIKEIEFFYKET